MNKKQLYESIMRYVSKEVKNVLNEDTYNTLADNFYDPDDAYMQYCKDEEFTIASPEDFITLVEGARNVHGQINVNNVYVLENHKNIYYTYKLYDDIINFDYPKDPIYQSFKDTCKKRLDSLKDWEYLKLCAKNNWPAPSSAHDNPDDISIHWRKRHK